MNAAEPSQIYIVHALEDERFRVGLEKHLSSLKRGKLISIIEKVPAGEHTEQTRKDNLAKAAIILFLLSPDFLNGYEEEEVELAVDRQQAGNAMVISILLRSVDFEGTPFAQLEVLPSKNQPIAESSSEDIAFKQIADAIRAHVAPLDSSHAQRDPEKEKRRSALLRGHYDQVQNLLGNFVGRQRELEEIRQLIDEKRTAGGYIIITGEAGEGKSSIIAKLIEFYDVDQAIFHFIPFGIHAPNYQVPLLKNLIEQLALKYDPLDLYTASDQRAALSGYFARILIEVAEKGGHEIIFIDGLDQLNVDNNGICDLSFLPTKLPSGIVFVLGTRSDVVGPLKSHMPYPLPEFSRPDFGVLLNSRGALVNRTIADQYYDKLKAHALYLDLVAKELALYSNLNKPDEIIARLAEDPNNIFSVTIERLQHQQKLWKTVIYPILGILLVAQEPLTWESLQSLLDIDGYEIRDGLRGLKGLITEDSQRRYTLFHPKFRDYLRSSGEHSQKSPLFSMIDERRWHKKLADWCDQDGPIRIWTDVGDSVEQARRVYARYYYVMHLYSTDYENWKSLFRVLDERAFGQATMRVNDGRRLYAQDLDLGRRAAASERWDFENGIKNLAALWRYTLLRGSLRSRADQYPDEALQMLLTLGRKMQVAELAELVANPVRKVEILLLITKHVAARSVQESEVAQYFQRAEVVAFSIENKTQKARALKALAIALAQAKRWDQAKEIALSIEEDNLDRWFKYSRAEALQFLVAELVHDGQWQRAQTISVAIMSSNSKDKTLKALIKSFAEAQYQEQAESIWQKIQRLALSEVNSSSIAFPVDDVTYSELLSLDHVERENYFERAGELDTQVMKLVHAHRWEEARKVAFSIQDNFRKVKTLSKLACFLYEANILDEAKSLCDEVEAIIQRASMGIGKIRALNSLAVTLAEMQPGELARQVAASIQMDYHQSRGLVSLSAALVRTRRWGEAQQVATSINDDKLKDEALAFLVTALVEVHDWGEAQRTIDLMHDKDKVLVSLTAALTQVQCWEEAWKVACSIQGRYDQSKALASLAAARADASHWDEAEKLAESIQNDSYRAEAFVALTTASIRARLQEQVDIFWIKAQEAISRIQYYDDGGYHNAMGSASVSFVKGLVEAKDWRQAREMALFIKEDDLIERDMHKDFVLCFLARALAEEGLWEQVEEIMDLMRYYHPLSRLLCDLAILSAEKRHWKRAELFLLDALQGSASWEDDRSGEAYGDYRENAWMSDENYHKGWWTFNDIEPDFRMGKALEFIAICVKARRWEQAEKIIAALPDTCKKVEALSQLAISLPQNDYWGKAQQAVSLLRSDREKVVALSTLASAFAGAKRWEQAQRYWGKAQKMALSMKYEWDKAQALDAIITSYSEHNRYEDILRIVQAVWLRAETRDDALKFFPFALRLIPHWPELGAELYEAFKWVDAYGRPN